MKDCKGRYSNKFGGFIHKGVGESQKRHINGQIYVLGNSNWAAWSGVSFYRNGFFHGHCNMEQLPVGG